MTLRAAILLGTASCAWMFAQPALAQDATASTSAADAAADASPTLDRIIVSARKRETTLQDTSGSITAIGSDALAQAGVVSIDDIGAMIPNVSIGEARLTGAHIISIRGISGQDGGIGQDEPAGVYLDGVYLGRPQGHFFALVDIERVEVLKGPQGTLYGRNSTAGAVNIITRKPSEDFGGLLEARVGSFDEYQVRGSVEGRILPGFAARASMSYRDVGGDLDNIFTGEAARGISEGLVRVVVDRSGQASGPDVNLSVDFGWAESDTALSNMTVDGNVYADPDTVSLDLPGRAQNRKTGGVGLTFNQELSDAWTLTTVSGFRHLDFDVRYDADATDATTFLGAITAGYLPAPVAILRDSTSYQSLLSNQFSQEARLQLETDRLDWVFGVFAYREESEHRFDVNFLAQSANIVSSAKASTNESTSYAVFTRAEYDLSDMFRIEGGLRYSSERKHMTRSIFTGAGGGLQTDEDLEDSWSDITGELTLDVRPREGVLGYVTFAQGFKSGGFNATQRNSPSFNPESVNSYEVGLKTDFLDNRARFNVSAFHMDYSDLQVRFVAGIGEIFIQNAAEATIDGVEFELTGQLSDSLTVSYSGAHLDAHYDEYSLGAVDFTGNRLNQAPEWSQRLALDYTQPVAGFGETRAHVSYSWQSEEFYRANNDPINGNPGYESLDARLGVSPDALPNLSLEIWGKNLTDDRYVGAVVPLANDLIFLGSINRGRSVGADIRYTF